jgi:hypothetical protein
LKSITRNEKQAMVEKGAVHLPRTDEGDNSALHIGTASDNNPIAKPATARPVNNNGGELAAACFMHMQVTSWYSTELAKHMTWEVHLHNPTSSKYRSANSNTKAATHPIHNTSCNHATYYTTKC